MSTIPTTDTPTPNVNRLISLAHWLTEQERRRRLGKPSEWLQSVWVRTEDETGHRRPVQVVEQGDSLLVEGWSCGTAACAAGHVSLEDGGRPAFYWGGQVQPAPPPVSHTSFYDDVWDAVSDTISSSQMFFGPRAEPIDEHARRVLGLTQDEANALFDGDNRWDRMIYLIAQFTRTPESELLMLVGADDLPLDPDGEDEEDDGEW